MIEVLKDSTGDLTHMNKKQMIFERTSRERENSQTIKS